jgi:hypothetical protein
MPKAAFIHCKEILKPSLLRKAMLDSAPALPLDPPKFHMKAFYHKKDILIG